MFRKLLAATAGVAALVVASSSTAVPVSFTFDSAGDLLQTFYNFTVDGAHVTTEVDYKLTAITSGQADLDVTVKNTTPLSEPGVNRIVSFGVDTVAPTLTGASTTNSQPTAGEWDATVTTNFPGFQSVDLCSFAGNNCAGGQGNGVLENSTETFHLILTGSFGATPSVTFTDPFPAKFQAVGNAGRSYEVPGTTCTVDCPVITPVIVPDDGLPEPGTLALLALGVLGIYVSSRRGYKR